MNCGLFAIQHDPKDPTDTQPEDPPPSRVPPLAAIIAFNLIFFLFGPSFFGSSPNSDPTTHDDEAPSPTPLGSEPFGSVGFHELRVWIDVTQHSCQLRSLRSAITSSNATNAKDEMSSFSVERDGFTRSSIFTASASDFCQIVETENHN
jgi:hypothetical protein